MENGIHIEPAYSLTPSKLVLYNRVFKAKSKQKFTWDSVLSPTLENFKDNFHGFNLSDNAKRNLQNKINWLYFLAPNRKVSFSNGKHIFNFKIAFVTLTLPSKQMHPTKEITQNLLNQFFTEVRRKFALNNYVWRLEFQKNGNVHYHIVWDIFVSYFDILNLWNGLLKKIGYLKKYTEKMSKLTLAEYNSLVNSDGKKDFKKISERFAKGVKSKWKTPNTVDVKSVVSNKRIAGYIAKYFSKAGGEAVNKNELDTRENSKNMRLWFCSRKLSKLKTFKGLQIYAKEDYLSLVTSIKGAKTLITDYCTIIYFDLKNAKDKFVQLIKKTLINYAISLGYFEPLTI